MTDSEKPDEAQQEPMISLEKSDNDGAPDPLGANATPTEVGAPYFDSEWSPAYAETEIREVDMTKGQPGPDDAAPQQEYNVPPVAPAYPTPPYPTPPYPAPQAPAGFTQDPYAQGGYAPQPPYSEQPPMPQAAPWYPAQQPVYQGVPGYAPSLGLAPQTGQVSAIVAIVVGALLSLTCYGTVIGIAPLVLGIMGVTKANSVTTFWISGQQQAAYEAAESSRKMAMWAWISMAIGIALVVLVVIIIVVIAANAN